MRLIQVALLFAVSTALAECVIQVPLYVNVRQREDYYDSDTSAVGAVRKAATDVPKPSKTPKIFQYNYDDEYYSVRDVKLGNPRKHLEHFGLIVP